MATTSAHLSVIAYDNAAGTPVDISGYANSFSGLDLLNEILEATAFGDTSRESGLGLKGGGSISVSGDWGSTLHAQFVAIDALTTGDTQTLKYSPAGTGSGTPYLQVETVLESFAPSSSVGDKVTYSASLKMTGNVTTGTN